MSTFRSFILEIHRRSLWQVLGIYAVASWVIYQVVLALYEGVGLPGWVPGTALVLLLIGLPIVLATAFVQEGGPAVGRPGPQDGLEGLETTAETVAVPRPTAGRAAPDPAAAPADGDGAPASEDSGLLGGPLFTWSKAITGGVLAFAALGLAATGFMGMRAMGVGPAATLISSGQLAERAPVVLADFESLTGDRVLARVVTEAFRADLAQSTAIDLTSPQDIGFVLERMDRPADDPLDAATAREVAARSGTKAVIAGDIGQIGGRYVLSARIIGALDGEVLVTEKATAADSTELVDAVDRLAKAVREEIGESLRSIRRSPYLTAITTPSLPALKKLVQSYEATNRGDEDRALVLLDEAIELDPSFSEAHRKRSAVLLNQGRISDGLEAIDRALAHPERLTDYERYHARALRALFQGDNRSAISEYRALLEVDSADSRALNNLGNVYFFLGEWGRMAAALRRSLDVPDEGPSASVYAPAYPLLAAAQWNRGLPDSARAVVEELGTLHPGSAVFLNARGILATAAGEYDVAEESGRRILEEHPGTTAQLNGTSLLAAAYAIQGQVGAALRQVEHAVSMLEDRGDTEGALGWDLAEVFQAALVLGDTARAEVALRRALARHPLSELERPPFHDLVWAHAVVGHADSARAMLERLRAEPDWVHGQYPWRVPEAEAAVAMAEGRHAEARERLRAAREAHPRCPSCYLPELGLTFERDARPDSAIAVYEEYLQVADAFRALGGNRDVVHRGFTLERLGSLHEDAGRTDQAARWYAEFVALWEDADPELQPRVQAARRALTRLTAEGG